MRRAPENWSLLRYIICRALHRGMQDVTDTYDTHRYKTTLHLQCNSCERTYWWVKP